MLNVLTVLWFITFVGLFLIAVVELVKLYAFHRDIRVHSPELYDVLGRPHILQSNSIRIFKGLKNFLNNKDSQIDTRNRLGRVEDVKKARIILTLWRLFNALFFVNLALVLLIFLGS